MVYKIGKIITKTKEHVQREREREREKEKKSSPKKRKHKRVIRWAKKTKNDIDQLKTRLTKTQTGKQDQNRVPTGG